MILTFRPIKVRPDDWKAPWYHRPAAPFGGTYQRTLVDLDREIRHLEGTDPFLQLVVADADLRLDGQLRSGARVDHPGVILTFQTKKHGPLTYGTDRYDHWHGNLRAIALGLDCLRRVERYGIAERGQQYAGYRELGTGIALGQGAMTREEAADFLIAYGEWGDVVAELDAILDAGPDVIDSYYRHAAKTLHPDVGGDPDLFRRLTQARDLLAPKGS